MKILHLAMIAALCAPSTAFAAISPDIDAQYSPSLRADPIAERQPVARPQRDRLVGPNECAADRAEPVWSANNSKLLGYMCVRIENGA
ncbi:MAG: hypothetical protein E7774_09485 [Bradyrhizobium sp.]|nr:MAG: hypothetical protein E7774_09485 [Bradyrhizobium sp.]